MVRVERRSRSADEHRSGTTSCNRAADCATARTVVDRLSRSNGLSDISTTVSDPIQVERALLALAPAERAAVIERGLRSLDEIDDSPQEDIDAAWAAELRRRVTEIGNCTVTLVSGAESDARVQALLAELHR